MLQALDTLSNAPIAWGDGPGILLGYLLGCLCLVLGAWAAGGRRV